MITKNKNYGFRTTLLPKSYFKDIKNNFEIEDIYFSIEDEVFTVGYDDKNKGKRAKELAEFLIKEWEFRNDKKINYDFEGYKWEHKDGNALVHAVTIKDKAILSERIKITTTKKTLGLSYMVVSDSHDFDRGGSKTTVIANNKSLKKVFSTYENEVLALDDQKKAYYGIYKILEELKHDVGNFDELSRIVGISKIKLKNIKQSAQPQRHARTPAQEVISIQESKKIIKELIKKYIFYLRQKDIKK